MNLDMSGPLVLLLLLNLVGLAAVLATELLARRRRAGLTSADLPRRAQTFDSLIDQVERLEAETRMRSTDTDEPTGGSRPRAAGFDRLKQAARAAWSASG